MLILRGDPGPLDRRWAEPGTLGYSLQHPDVARTLLKAVSHGSASQCVDMLILSLVAIRAIRMTFEGSPPIMVSPRVIDPPQPDPSSPPLGSAGAILGASDGRWDPEIHAKPESATPVEYGFVRGAWWTEKREMSPQQPWALHCHAVVTLCFWVWVFLVGTVYNGV